MKCFRRCLSVLFVFVLLSTAFSLSVSADSSETVIQYDMHRRVDNAWLSSDYYFSYTSNDDIEILSQTAHGNYGVPPGYSSCSSYDVFTVSSPSGSLIKKGGNTSVSIYNVIAYALVDHESGPFYSRDIVLANVLIGYADGSYEYLDISDMEFSVIGSYNLTFEFVPKKDVKTIEVHTRNIIDCPYSSSSASSVTLYSGQVPNYKTLFEYQQTTEEAGLLKTVIEWLKGIKNGITDLFDSITELPSKLWSLIENGLKSLFIPSEEFIVGFKDDLHTLLSDRLGAVYQVVDITLNSWEDIKNYDEKNTILMPETTIPLPNDNEFSFGGFEVQIVPNGFEVLVTALKTIVAIVCSIMFINGLRHRYDEVMGVEK